MAVQSSESLSPASESSHSSVIDDLLDIVTSRDLNSTLGKVLRIVIRMLSAEAGSIFFQAHSPRSIQFGAFRPEALERIQLWEESLSKRLQEKQWIIPSSTSLPVSVSKLPGSQLLLVSAPLVQGQKVVGALSCVLPPGSSLTTHKRSRLTRILQGLGQLTSLIADLELAQNRLHHVSIFYDVGQALVTTFDITKLLSEAMELATRLIDAGAASIVLIDEAKNELEFKVSHSSHGVTLRQQRIPMDEGIAGWVARNGRPVIANNARADSRFSHRVDVRTGFLTQSIAAVPLKVKGRIIGVLEVLNKYSGTGFNQDDIELMNFIAMQAAIAIENARLYEQICNERGQLIKTYEEISRKLTRSLQEGPKQYLTAVSMGLDHLERLSTDAPPKVIKNEIGALRNLVHQANRETRNLLFDLRPLVLETQGLVATCEELVTQLRTTERFIIHFKSVEQAHYDPKLTKTIFSIIQEAINNIRQHAQADNVWLSLEVKRGRFVVTIRDDGQGFEVDKIYNNPRKPVSVGLFNMRQRAALIEAELEIESRSEPPNRGTSIQVALPWPPK
jgi:signal transduction histidine kinase